MAHNTVYDTNISWYVVFIKKILDSTVVVVGKLSIIGVVAEDTTSINKNISSVKVEKREA